MDFSAAPMPAIRKVLEIIGWGLVAILIITGLSAIFARTGFFVMVLGPLQFMRGVRKKHIKLHRISAAELWISCTRTPGNGACHWKDMDAKVAQA